MAQFSLEQKKKKEKQMCTRTTTCYFPGFLPTAFLVAACLHTSSQRHSLQPWHRKRISNLCTAQLFCRNLTVTLGSCRRIRSHLRFSHKANGHPSFCPPHPPRCRHTLTLLRSACLHPASVALFIWRHGLNLATLHLQPKPLEDIAYGAAHVFMRAQEA